MIYKIQNYTNFKQNWIEKGVKESKNTRNRYR